MRSAGLSDVESILSFWRESVEGTNRQDDRPSVERLLNRDPDALLLAVVGKDIVGTVIAGWDGSRCHLYRIAVRGDWRRQGVARALISAAEARFSSQGALRVDAMVLEDNALGRAAWNALGYQPQHEWRRWIKRLDGRAPSKCPVTDPHTRT